MKDDAILPSARALARDAIADLEGFSRITSLASSMLGCPYAVLTLREGNYQAIRGWSGSDFSDLTGCDPLFALCRPEAGPQLIGDARSDPRLCTSAVVTGAPLIRSVLALPIRSEEGSISGMLCAMSPEPAHFDLAQIAPLTLFAELAEQGISLHVRTRALSRVNATLQQSQKIFRQAERAANIGSWRVDLATGGLDWSDQVFRINGLEPGHEIGVEQAVALYQPEDRDMVASALEHTIAHGTPFSFETSILRSDGQLRRVRVVGERIDVDGEPNSVAGIIQDCTEEHLRNVALKRAAEHDGLTGLFNRGSFERRLVAAMENVAHEPVTVALLDLDGFKEVNDTLGHLLGDRVLEGVARQLSEGMEPGVFLARWGGDEFAILFPPTMAPEEVSRLLKELIAGFNELAPIGTSQFRIGATCGIARVENAVRTEEIMRRADLALYRGKEDGRGAVVWWDEQIEAIQCERQHAIAQLRGALGAGRVIAAYQPIVDLEIGQPVSVEALLRLRTPDGRLLAASDVFAALLDAELSRQVSQAMLDQIIADGPTIIELFGSNCRIGLNLSEADLRHGDFVRHLIEAIDDSPLSPRNITIELTETMLIDARGQARASLALLDECGFTICLDDFGTGFSSLTHLRAFPIHKVKIDRDFIAGISEDHQSRLIVQAIVQMSQSLGLRVVAEGVETEEQEIFLRAIGCRHVQGYRHGRPALLVDLCEQYGAPAKPRIPLRQRA